MAIWDDFLQTIRKKAGEGCGGFRLINPKKISILRSSRTNITFWTNIKIWSLGTITPLLHVGLS